MYEFSDAFIALILVGVVYIKVYFWPAYIICWIYINQLNLALREF